MYLCLVKSEYHFKDTKFDENCARKEGKKHENTEKPFKGIGVVDKCRLPVA